MGHAINARTAAENPSFMLVSGITATEEMCLTVADGKVGIEGADAILEPCSVATAAGDGRELWQHLSNGQIVNAGGKKCLGAEGDTVVLTGCDSGSTWETQGNGQLKLGRAGNYCLSQSGLAAGVEDAAARGAITSSSSADAAAHGANMAVDGSSKTFWASALDPAGPVTVTVDLGGLKHLSDLEIAWEFPAKSFSVGVSSDGVKWSEVFATDSNILSSTRIALGSMSATKLRVVMHEAGASFQGQAVYGIQTLSVGAHRLQSMVADCAAAGKSSDARDKYFETYVGEFAPGSSKALRSELPALEAARASLASVVSALAGALPKMKSCHGAPAAAAAAAAAFSKSDGGSAVMLARSVDGNTRSASTREQMAENVDRQNGVNAPALSALFKESRRIIIASRSALF